MAPTRKAQATPVAITAATPAGTTGRIMKTVKAKDGKVKVKTAKPAQVTFACSACRAKKSKCTGERPTCTSCAKSGRECVYAGEEGETREGRWRRKAMEEQVRAIELCIRLDAIKIAFDHFKTLPAAEMKELVDSANRFEDFVGMFAAARTLLDLVNVKVEKEE